jgi:hypothetical protein
MTALGRKATFCRKWQLQNAALLITVILCGISTEIMEQLVNTPYEIEVRRGGTLKLVKMQAANAPLPMLSMPSWRRIGVRRERANAQLQIFLSEVRMLIFITVWPQPAKEPSPISMSPSHSSTSFNFFRLWNALAGIDVTDGSTRTCTTSSGIAAPPSPM